jgi:hypothetical protein
VETSRYTHIAKMLTKSNERQRTTGTRQGMRLLAPWRQGDPRNYATNLQTLAHAALRSHYSFDRLWNRHIRDIIYTGLGMDSLTRRRALATFYLVRRAHFWRFRRGAGGP